MALGQTITGFTDQGLDLGTKYVTKEYISTFYPNLVPSMKQPTLYAWGQNLYGNLGDGTIINKSSPVTVLGTGAAWVQIAASFHSFTINSSGGIKSDGTLWTWGHNTTYGMLGDGTTVNKSSPITTAGGGTNWRQVACGYYAAAAIKTDGTLWTWGFNAYGQLGDGTVVNRSSPVTTVGGGTNWRQVAAGGYYSTAAVKTDGTLWTWGNNGDGQLGDGTVANRSSPVTTVAGGTNWRQVACGYSIAAIKTDGTLWTWGWNSSYGQLGDGTTINRSSPVTTAGGGTNWSQVSTGGMTVCAIKSDGTLWTWGYNGYGEVGDGTQVDKSSPVTTVAGGTNWRQVACSYSVAAVKTDGTLWTWGYNNNGQLGDGTVANRSSPVTTVAGGTNWKSVAAGMGAFLAISEAQGY